MRTRKSRRKKERRREHNRRRNLRRKQNERDQKKRKSNRGKKQEESHSHANGEAGREFGHQNEHRVELALIRNKKRVPLIFRCHNAFENGELDFRGIDIVIALKNGFCLLLQIKSSHRALAAHYRHHPLIPAFVAERNMSDVQITAAVLKIIRRQAKLPFEIADFYPAGMSRELKRLGTDGLVVLANGFGLFLRREGGEDYGNKDRPCQQMPTIEIPNAWDADRIRAELKKIVEIRRKRFFETGGHDNAP